MSDLASIGASASKPAELEALADDCEVSNTASERGLADWRTGGLAEDNASER